MVLIRPRPRAELARSQPGQEPLLAVVPLMELSREGTELVITVELPGVEPDDVNVELSTTTLLVSGQKFRPEEPSRFLRTERRYGRFERQVSLPMAVREAEAHGVFRNGVLTIRAPLEEQTRLPGATRIIVEPA